MRLGHCIRQRSKKIRLKDVDPPTDCDTVMEAKGPYLADGPDTGSRNQIIKSGCLPQKIEPYGNLQATSLSPAMPFPVPLVMCFRCVDAVATLHSEAFPASHNYLKLIRMRGRSIPGYQKHPIYELPLLLGVNQISLMCGYEICRSAPRKVLSLCGEFAKYRRSRG